jgi:prephenate dehydrogenase
LSSKEFPLAKPVITIIGLGLVGASLGLALQRQSGNFELVGHDKDGEATQVARRLGAVHRTEWNLHNACDGADMIILTTPVSEMRDLLPHLRADLKPTTLLFAVTDVFQPVLALASQLLPEATHFVAGQPVLTGIGGGLTPRADLFDEITFCVAAGADTDPASMQLASDLVERVGAKPLFVDPQEHDGLIAGVEQLPQLVAAALVRLNVRSAGWREGRRLAGRQFAQSTELGDNAELLTSAWQANRENLLLRLEQLRQELTEWQQWLAADPAVNGEAESTLGAAVEQVVQERLQWEGQAMLKQWEDPPKPPARAEGRGMLQQMFLGGLIGRRSSPPDHK